MVDNMAQSTMVRLMMVLETIGVRDAHYGIARGARIEVLYKVRRSSGRWYKGTIMKVYGNNVEIWFDDGQVDIYGISELEEMVGIGEIRNVQS